MLALILQCPECRHRSLIEPSGHLLTLTVKQVASKGRCTSCGHLGVSVEVLQKSPRMGAGNADLDGEDRRRLEVFREHLAS